MGITDITRVGLAWQRLRYPLPPPEPAPPGVLVGRAESGEPVIVPTPTRRKAASALVLGSTGCGKTALVALLALGEQLNAIAEGRVPDAVTILDPKGDIGDYLVGALSAELPEALSRIIWLDPFERRQVPFPLNLRHLEQDGLSADERAWFLASLSNVVSTGMGTAAHLGQGARQQELIALLIGATLTASHPAASPVWAVDALTLGPKGIRALAELTPVPRYREALQALHMGDELRASVLARLRLMCSATEQIEAMASAPGCVDLERLLAPGVITVISLRDPPAGNVGLVRYFANLLVRLLFERAMCRPSSAEGPMVRFVLDELPVVSETLHDCLERGLAVGRSKGLSFVLASQTLKQLEVGGNDLLVTLILSQIPWRAAGRLPAREAELCAREQAPGPGIDESASAMRARLSGIITNLTDRNFVSLRAGARQRFVSETVDMEGWLRAAQDRATEIGAQKQRLWLPADLGPRVRLADLIPAKRRARPRPKAGRREDGPPPTPGGEPPPPTSEWG